MGTFDRIFAPCPRCGKSTEFQSKGGKCELKKYNYRDVPADVADYADGSTEICDCCGCKMVLICPPMPRVKMDVQEYGEHQEEDEWD